MLLCPVRRKGDGLGRTTGSIINIAPGAALRGSLRGVHYVASKGGILSLTRAMALELAPYRIRVNAIARGLMDTAQRRHRSSEEEIVEMARAIPFGRMARNRTRWRGRHREIGIEWQRNAGPSQEKTLF